MCRPPSPYRDGSLHVWGADDRPQCVPSIPDRVSSIGAPGSFYADIRTRTEPPPECFGRFLKQLEMLLLWYRFRCEPHIFTGRRGKIFVGLLVRIGKDIILLCFSYRAPLGFPDPSELFYV